MASATFKYAHNLPNSLFANNRKRFLAEFKKTLGASLAPNSLMLFKGKEDIPIDSTDQNYVVKQESYFYYLFGVQETGFYGAINVDTEECTIFAPEPNPIYRIWMVVLNTEDYKKKYNLNCLYLKELESFVGKVNPKKIFLNSGVNSDSGSKTLIPTDEWLSKKFSLDLETMYPILTECRVIKSPEELEIMAISCQSAAEGHIEAMKNCKPEILESYLVSKIRSHALENYNIKLNPYGDIMGSGINSSTLHYEDANKVIKPNELILCDCGNYLCGYASDITTVFPSSGKFTEKQKAVYNIVLEANRKIQATMKPGVSWVDMHKLAEKTILTGLAKLGLLKGDIDEMVEKRVGYLFMPHGLGHFLGLDVHDCGGYLKDCPPRIQQPGLKNLRTSRILKEGMVITVEPGCYFIEFLLKEGGKMLGIPTHYLNMDEVAKYFDFGGIRIEDDVTVTKDGSRRLTHVPRTVEQVEACMAGKDWTKIPEKL